MDYKVRLAEIRKQHKLKADKEAFTQFMAAQHIPVDFVKWDGIALSQIFKIMDRPSVEPYQAVDGRNVLDWRQELLRAVASLRSGTSNVLFLWRDIFLFEREHLLVFNPAHLEHWLDAYNPSLRGSDLLFSDLAGQTFIAVLFDEHDVKFKRLTREEILQK